MKRQRFQHLLALATAAGLAGASSASAASFNLDFSEDPTLTGQVTLFGSAQWRDAGGNTGGYLSVTDAMNSQRGVIVFGDLDNSLVVKAFSFSLDVRIGGGTGNPADGFSVNYVRAGDDVLDDGEGWSDIGNAGDLNLPEEGAKTGLAVGFDSYLSGGGTITDMIGLSVRVDNQLLAQYAFPTLNGALTNTNSLQTGLQNPDYSAAEGDPIEESWALLGWAKFEVNLAEDGKLTIKYKGREVTPAGGLQTTFFPSPGQLVFAGRTGAENQNHHIDNIQITTIPAERPFFTGLSGTATGFTFQISDGATQVVTNSVQVKLNGAPITLSSITRDGNTVTGAYLAPAPLTAGATNTVEVTFRDSANVEDTAVRDFIVRPYSVLTPADAVAAVDRTAPGFTARVHQLPIGRFPGDANSVRNAERQLANRYIDPATGQPYPNRADLSGAVGGLFVITNTINWNQDVNTTPGAEAGSFQSGSEPSRPDEPIPGIPGTEFNPDGSFYTDNIATEILTYLELKKGLYRFGVNSDDGFRFTAGQNYREIFKAPMGVYDGGKGSSDVLFDVYVEQDGLYPTRLSWWEGGGGANLEFFTLDEATGEKILVNDRAVTGHVAAFRSSTAPSQPFVEHALPASGETGVFPGPNIAIDLRDGSVAVDDSSITLTLNGAPVTTTLVNSGTLTTVNATVGSLQPSGSTNTVVLSYRATGSQATVTKTWNFVTAPYISLPSEIASPLGSGTAAAPGFNARIYQVERAIDSNSGAAIEPPNDLNWAEAVNAGLAGPNTANLVEAVTPIETVINLNEADAAAGGFGGDTVIPGIPGNSSTPLEYITGEFTTFIEFPAAGAYRMGVNSDDGFRLTAAEERTRTLLQIEAPSSIAGPVLAAHSVRGLGGTFGPLSPGVVTADVVVANPADGCTDFTNAGEMAGKIVLIDRGTCAFAIKVGRAEAAGAIAVIIVQNHDGWPTAGSGGELINIPMIMVSRATGNLMKSNAAGLRVSLGQDTAPLVGEFNGGRGSDASFFNGTLMTFNVPQAGVYPFRLLWQEGTGGANVEWYSISASGEGILINDRTNPRALKAFRTRTFTARPAISIARSGQNVVITYSGTLEAADSITGPFTVVTGTSPQTIPVAAAGNRFFRARQ